MGTTRAKITTTLMLGTQAEAKLRRQRSKCRYAHASHETPLNEDIDSIPASTPFAIEHLRECNAQRYEDACVHLPGTGARVQNKASLTRTGGSESSGRLEG